MSTEQINSRLQAGKLARFPGWLAIGYTHTFLTWLLDGRSVLLPDPLVPLSAGESLPRLPKVAFQSEEEIAQLPGARRIEGGGVVLGPSADVYAFYRGTIQRNLYSFRFRESLTEALQHTPE